MRRLGSLQLQHSSLSIMSEVTPRNRPAPIQIRISDPSLLIVPACAITFGFVSGLLTASQRSSLQFLAENAHRQPTTLQGWYFYNKTKNYRVALDGFRGGLRTGARLGVWTGAFVGLKEGCRAATGWGEIRNGAASGLIMSIAASILCEKSRGSESLVPYLTIAVAISWHFQIGCRIAPSSSDCFLVCHSVLSLAVYKISEISFRKTRISCQKIYHWQHYQHPKTLCTGQSVVSFASFCDGEGFKFSKKACNQLV